MIIRIIPETDSEKKTQREEEHRGVKEFLLFGNKEELDVDPVNFHLWNGSYRYLLGSLHYFHEVINDERQENSNLGKEVRIPDLKLNTAMAGEKEMYEKKKGLFKQGEMQDIQILDPKEIIEDDGFVKDDISVKEDDNNEENKTGLRIV